MKKSLAVVQGLSGINFSWKAGIIWIWMMNSENIKQDLCDSISWKPEAINDIITVTGISHGSCLVICTEDNMNVYKAVIITVHEITDYSTACICLLYFLQRLINSLPCIFISWRKVHFCDGYTRIFYLYTSMWYIFELKTLLTYKVSHIL